MPFIVYAGIILSVYIASFYEDFSKEEIDKVKLFFIVIIVLIFSLGIIGSVLGGK